MPIPAPHDKEEKERFISKCMGDSVMNKEFPEQSQRYAVCLSQWKKSKEKSKASEEVKWEDQSNNSLTIIY